MVPADDEGEPVQWWTEVRSASISALSNSSYMDGGSSAPHSFSSRRGGSHSFSRDDGSRPCVPGVLYSDVPNETILGQGQYGTVWRAMHESSRQYYAVKSVSAPPAHSASAVAEREQFILLRFMHAPHASVVQVLDVYAFLESSVYTFVMELCDGGDLMRRITRQHHEAHAAGRRYQAPPERSRWLSQVFQGLRHLHLTADTLLRDLKPQNVVLTGCGNAKLIDFGAAALHAGEHVPVAGWSLGVTPGSPGYVAPEVLRGDSYSAKADFYSFGVLVWMLETGGQFNEGMPEPPHSYFPAMGIHDMRPLFDDWKVLRELVQRGGGAVPALQEPLRVLVLQLIEREPAARPDHQVIMDRILCL